MRIAFLCQLWPAVLQDLQRRYDCVEAVNPAAHDKWQLVADAEIVVLRSPVVLDRETIDRARCLRLSCARARDWTTSIERHLASAGFR